MTCRRLLILVSALAALVDGAAAPTDVKAAEPTSSAATLAHETAVDVQQDLALLPSGVLVTLKTGQALESWGTFSQVVGRSEAGCGVLRSGGATCWKRDGQPATMERLGQVASIAGSLEAGCAARQDGRVICWDHFERDPPAGTMKRAEILAPEFGDERPKKTLPLRYSDLPELRDVVAVTGGRDGCALHRSGGISCWGERFSTRSPTRLFYDAKPYRVPGLSHVRQVVQDGYTRCAVDDGGKVFCWGGRFVTWISTAAWWEAPFDEVPRRVPGIADAVQVAISKAAESACAVRKTGQVICWGIQACGPRRSPQPRTMPDLRDVARVSFSFPESCAVHRKGGFSCWRGCSLGANGIQPASLVAPG
jgi:hypothetical protein